MTAPLSDDALSRLAADLPGWTVAPDGLTRTFRMGSFRAAMAFLVRVAFEAEEMNHHPEIENVYDRVTFRLRTHDAGDRVTARDVDLARRIEACLGRRVGTARRAPTDSRTFLPATSHVVRRSSHVSRCLSLNPSALPAPTSWRACRSCSSRSWAAS
jgi:4a-hydroxytetrahydrobiopterin dehydratase